MIRGHANEPKVLTEIRTYVVDLPAHSRDARVVRWITWMLRYIDGLREDNRALSQRISDLEADINDYKTNWAPQENYP